MDKIRKKDKYFLVVLCILLVSFIFNIYQGITNKKYKGVIEASCYANIEEIRHNNESALTILESCIELESISNNELLSLYKNYSAIANAEVELWEYYLEYKDNSSIKTSRKDIDLESSSINEIYWQIEELIYEYIQNDISSNTFSMVLKDKDLENFKIIKEISSELNNYYIEFYDEKCNNLDEEKKEKKVIKNAYWIEILNEMQKINEKFIDYEFISGSNIS